MVEKFGISEKDEFTILSYWLKDTYNNLLKIPESLKRKITEEQTTNLFAHYQDLGNNNDGKVNIKEIQDRVNELEKKFQEQKEQSFIFILKKELKEKSAKFVVWVIMSLIGFVLGFLVSYLSK
ncbi:hypothetical protein HYX12_04340 [Candidatus Woesearchaeota archaeon]|nr:hypothetical protein [Candidatus Woesearchaeota archaeon]